MIARPLSYTLYTLGLLLAFQVNAIGGVRLGGTARDSNPPGRGVVLTSVNGRDSVAGQLGLRPGDIILYVKSDQRPCWWITPTYTSLVKALSLTNRSLTVFFSRRGRCYRSVTFYAGRPVVGTEEEIGNEDDAKREAENDGGINDVPDSV